MCTSRCCFKPSCSHPQLKYKPSTSHLLMVGLHQDKCPQYLPTDEAFSFFQRLDIALLLPDSIFNNIVTTSLCKRIITISSCANNKLTFVRLTYISRTAFDITTVLMTGLIGSVLKPEEVCFEEAILFQLFQLKHLCDPKQQFQFFSSYNSF